MNYYPNNNFYSNYSYSNPYQPSQQFNQYQNPVSTSTVNIQGKVVDGEEMVKAAEVPFGGYCVFPKADLSEIYIKTWNNNGTTQIINYKPQAVTSEEKTFNDIVLEKMDLIESKLNQLTSEQVSQQPQSTNPVSNPTEIRRESKANAY